MTTQVITHVVWGICVTSLTMTRSCVFFIEIHVMFFLKAVVSHFKINSVSMTLTSGSPSGMLGGIVFCENSSQFFTSVRV